MKYMIYTQTIAASTNYMQDLWLEEEPWMALTLEAVNKEDAFDILQNSMDVDGDINGLGEYTMTRFKIEEVP